MRASWIGLASVAFLAAPLLAAPSSLGDVVLLEDQVNPVMSIALDDGVEVTALHNHVFWGTALERTGVRLGAR